MVWDLVNPQTDSHQSLDYKYRTHAFLLFHQNSVEWSNQPCKHFYHREYQIPDAYEYRHKEQYRNRQTYQCHNHPKKYNQYLF